MLNNDPVFDFTDAEDQVPERSERVDTERLDGSEVQQFPFIVDSAHQSSNLEKAEKAVDVRKEVAATAPQSIKKTAKMAGGLTLNQMMEK